MPRLYDFYEDDGKYIIIQEYDMLALIIQILEGFINLHQNNIS